jgi:hypothetical protein
MCLRRAPEKYIAGAALDRDALEPVEVTLGFLFGVTFVGGSVWVGKPN